MKWPRGVRVEGGGVSSRASVSVPIHSRETSEEKGPARVTPRRVDEQREVGLGSRTQGQRRLSGEAPPVPE